VTRLQGTDRRRTGRERFTVLILSERRGLIARDRAHNRCMIPSDPFDIQRFVDAQEPLIASVFAELAAGRKRTHWMWFVFPQLRGLGSSPTANFYGITSLDEARAYLAHRILGSRLGDCTSTVLGLTKRSPYEIFGSPDDLKFHSSMTLFAAATSDPTSVFARSLHRFFDDRTDPRTVERLATR